MNQGNLASRTSQTIDIPLAVPILNTLGGVLGAGYGVYLSKQGLEQTYTALKCSDSKGVFSGAMNTGVGFAFRWSQWGHGRQRSYRVSSISWADHYENSGSLYSRFNYLYQLVRIGVV